MTHNTGYNVFIKGALIEPGDHITFVRKDMALDGTDADPNNGVVDDNDAANCAQANAGTIPVSNIGADDTVNDYGGEIRRACKQNAAPDCNPATCTVYPEDVNVNPTYHPDCRYESEFNMLGTADTIDPDRNPWGQISGVAPSAPPWFNDLDDTHYDNGGSNNALVAGTGQTDATYDESGTYYVSNPVAQIISRTLPGETDTHARFGFRSFAIAKIETLGLQGIKLSYF